MAAALGPTVRRKQLGAELRRLRRQADVSMEQVAAVLDCARSRVGHVENGRNTIRKAELTVLLDLYGAIDDERTVLDELRQEASKRGWWSTYRLPSWLSTFVGLETDAQTIRTFEGELVPGLLQTEAYARRIHVVATQSTPREELDRHVAARIERQKRLIGADATDYGAIVSEAAFRRALADPEGIGREQIEHLIAIAALPNVALHVLPYAAGLHPSMSGSFTVLDFDDQAAPVGYQEYAVGGHLVDDPETVRKLLDLWNTLHDLSLSSAASREWLSRILDQAT